MVRPEAQVPGPPQPHRVQRPGARRQDVPVEPAPGDLQRAGGVRLAGESGGRRLLGEGHQGGAGGDAGGLLTQPGR